MKVAIVIAMDRNKLIGKAGGLPWHIPAELQHFKEVTMGKSIIMGRKTWDSIGRPLPGRTSIVVTRNREWCAQGALAAADLDAALALAGSQPGIADECCVIGGAQLCAQAMPHADRLYLTLIDAEFDGDTWLESYCADDWHTVEQANITAGEQGEFALSYCVLERPRII